MIDAILFAVFTALSVWFIHACFWPGMIFGFVRKVFYSLPLFIKKPLYLCVICMTPWYGTAIWILFGKGMGMDLVFNLLFAGGIVVILSLALPENAEA